MEARKPNMPKLPEGYRWVVKNSEYDNDIKVSLQEKVETTYGIFVKKKEVDYRYVSTFYSEQPPLAQLIEQAANKIIVAHIKSIEKAIERIDVLGVYEA